MANLTQTTETPKLHIAATVTETKSIEREIPIPYYFRDDFRNICKVISKDHFISARCDNNYWGFQTYPIGSFKERIAKGTPCTEDEFNYAFEQAIMYGQALATDQPIDNSVDENVQIDEILEKRAS